MTTSRLPIDAHFSQSELHRLFDFDRVSGCLVWRARGGNMFWWDAKYANKPAGHAHATSGYTTVNYKRRIYLAHRLIWIWHHGSLPVGEIDHINRDKRDNRIENLRDVSHRENATNVQYRRGDLVGVSRIRKNGRWRAYINIDGKPTHLGSFASAGDAINARKEAEARR